MDFSGLAVEVRLDAADLTVVTDNEHSTPKRLTVSADGGTGVTVGVNSWKALILLTPASTNLCRQMMGY